MPEITPAFSPQTSPLSLICPSLLSRKDILHSIEPAFSLQHSSVFEVAPKYMYMLATHFNTCMTQSNWSNDLA